MSTKPLKDEMNEETKTPITDVRTVGVPVTDQDRALAFYIEKLGFEKRLDAPVEQFGGRWIEVAPPCAAMTIALVPTYEGVSHRWRDRHPLHDRRRGRRPRGSTDPRRRRG
jgi:catechol 2,3-dioxygenase-like lactoylglutathione lyase family enzyme